MEWFSANISKIIEHSLMQLCTKHLYGNCEIWVLNVTTLILSSTVKIPCTYDHVPKDICRKLFRKNSEPTVMYSVHTKRCLAPATDDVPG